MDVSQLLAKQAEENPQKISFIFKDQKIRFSQLRDAVFKLADSLINLGINKADKVGIYLPNCPEYVFSYLAIWSIGATAVPLDFMLTEEELVSCISHAQTRLLIVRPKVNLSLVNIKSRCPDLGDIIICAEKKDNFLTFEEFVARGRNKPPKREILDKDYAIIFYTSGTTGKPKGVLVNYQQLEAPPQALKYFVREFVEEETGICALPFSHLAGLLYLEFNVAFGVPFVLMERFSPLDFLRSLQDNKVTFFWLVPSMYYAMLQLKEFESFDLSHIRWLVIFGAPSSADAIRRFHQYCPKATLYHGWGMTETNAPTCVIEPGSKKIESVGKPAPWIEIKVFDENDIELPPGAVGEIVVRSWVVSDGYYKDPQATARVMRNGWFHTGDLGRFDSEGDLFIVGRKKEMIKVAGEIVFEPEIEAALHRHPAVAEVAVVGVPDKLRGEVPKAFVVLKDGNRPNEEDLRYFCRQHLAHFKIPHYFEFSPLLPKNRAGKIDKERLRERTTYGTK